MSNEELVKEIQQGINTSCNMESLYINNKPYIYQIAKKYMGYTDIEDLMQEAYLGLYEAVQRYEDSHEVKFMSYAGYWIQQFIHRYVEQNSSSVRMPAHLNGKIIEYQKIVKVYQRDFNRDPTVREICYTLNITEEQYIKLKKAIHRKYVTSLDMQLTEDDTMTLIDTVPSDEDIEENVIEGIYNKELKKDLWRLVHDILPDDERKIIKLRYKSHMTLDGIGQTIGVSRDRVRQSEAKALRKLRSGTKYRAFKNKYEEQLCFAWKGSVGSFHRTWMSSTERAALEIYDEDVRHIKLKIDCGESFDLSVQDTLMAFKNGWL